MSSDSGGPVHRASFSTRDSPRLLYSSVSPEVGEIEGRSSTEVSHDGEEFGLEVESPDLVSLRAGVNSWLRLCDVALSSAEKE